MNSMFFDYLCSIREKRTYLDKLFGNNGDHLILLGTEYALQRAGCCMVEDPKDADQILLKGGGLMVDVYQTPEDYGVFRHYRENYPDTTLVMGPSTYRFRGFDFSEICHISEKADFILFARDRNSLAELEKTGLPKHCKSYLSHDAAFEFEGSKILEKWKRGCSSEHVLVAMRKDKEGIGGVLVKMRAPWIPTSIRRKISWIRDRLVAKKSTDSIQDILRQEPNIQGIPIVYRDASCSVSFDEYVQLVQNAALVITDRLHVGVLGHLLDKRVYLICATEYHLHKIKGVYELSMSGPASNTNLYIPDNISQ